MSRHNRSYGTRHTTKQKGKSLKGTGVGTYSTKKKGKDADRYDRPYLTGNYRHQNSTLEQ